MRRIVRTAAGFAAGRACGFSFDLAVLIGVDLGSASGGGSPSGDFFSPEVADWSGTTSTKTQQSPAATPATSTRSPPRSLRVSADEVTHLVSCGGPDGTTRTNYARRHAPLSTMSANVRSASAPSRMHDGERAPRAVPGRSEPHRRAELKTCESPRLASRLDATPRAARHNGCVHVDDLCGIKYRAVDLAPRIDGRTAVSLPFGWQGICPYAALRFWAGGSGCDACIPHPLADGADRQVQPLSAPPH
jgi:hypothetical protein